MSGTWIMSGHNDRMLWHRLGLTLGAGVALPALLIVWHWPGQHSPPSMGPAVVLGPPLVQAPPTASASRPGRPAEPSPTSPQPSACPGSGGREVAALPPPESEDDDFWDDLTDLEVRDGSGCLWGDDDDDEWDD
ncbi:hypothetical protein GCM10018791_26630 [Streptomyces zaomyceticus]|nr:hypothetical protein GCM10018791_26630 [Streptomyces zaomyceticus]